MIQNGLMKDAYEMCLWVLDSVALSDQYAFINIAKTSNKTFTYPAVIEIPTSFGYTYDRVPQILSEEKIILAKYPGLWFQNIGSGESVHFRELNKVARGVGFLSDKQAAYPYLKFNSSYVDEGPKCAGLFSVLVDLNRMRDFVLKAKGTMPVFNDNSSELLYLGESIEFSGLQAKCAKFLINHLNSIVPKSQMYAVIYDKPESDYLAKIKVKGTRTAINEPIEKIFDNVKKKILGSTKLKNVLICTQQEGFGIFLNQGIVSLGQ